MAPRGRGRGNRFADLNDVHEREEATREDQLAVRFQRMEEQFVARSR
jgi:hypothetical protein